MSDKLFSIEKKNIFDMEKSFYSFLIENSLLYLSKLRKKVQTFFEILYL